MYCFGMVFFVLSIFTPEGQLIREPFTAAVVDYQPIRLRKDPPLVVIKRNVEKYIELIDIAQQKGIQIIIFPEAGLTTYEYQGLSTLHAYSQYISDEMLDKDLCEYLNSEEDKNNILKSVGCAARAGNMNVILTLIEVDNENFFTSTIAFNSSGYLIKKMRRNNLITNEIQNEAEELNLLFGNFTIVHSIDYLFKLEQSSKIDKYYILSSLYDSKEKLSEITKVHSFGANNLHILSSSYLDYNNGFLGSIISTSRKSYIESEGSLIVAEIHPKFPTVGASDSMVQLVNSKNIFKKYNGKIPTITKFEEGSMKSLQKLQCNVSVAPDNNIEKFHYAPIIIGDETYTFCGIQHKFQDILFSNQSINVSLTNDTIISSHIPLTYCNTSLPIDKFEYYVTENKLLLKGENITCETGHLILIGIMTKYENSTNENKIMNKDENNKNENKIMNRNMNPTINKCNNENLTVFYSTFILVYLLYFL